MPIPWQPLSLRPTHAGLGLAALLLAGVVVGMTSVGRGAAGDAFQSLAGADRNWLVLAGAACAGGLLCSAAAWSVGLRACGGAPCYTQVSARYAVGSLVNAVAPAHAGGAVRLGLMAQTLSGGDRVLRAGGVGAAMALARGLVLACLVGAAAAVTHVSFWPAALLVVAVAAALVLCALLSRRGGRLTRLLEVVPALARSPRQGVSLFLWIVCAFGARLAAAASVAVAFGAPGPLWVALLLVTAIALAGLLPLTPGNFGTGAAAASLALHQAAGIGVGGSLAIGLAFQAVETLAGASLGLAGAAVLAAPSSSVRRWSLAAAGAAAVFAAAVVGFASVDVV